MKLTAILLTVACLQLSASGISQQRISLSVKNMSLENVFSLVKKQTGYLFLYQDQLVEDARLVTISVTNKPVFEVLDSIFKDQPLKYTIIGEKTINIYSIGESKSTPDISRFPTTLFDSLPPSFTARVLNPEGIPLEGATVKLSNNKKTVLTDNLGKFSINAKRGDVITISFIGYDTYSHVVKESDKLVGIRLKVAENKLDEVVYTAYGKTSKRLNTGDITKVSGEDIANVPVLNPLLALEGRVPGLIISKTTGYASSPVKTLLRGQLNVNPGVSSEPLYVVDGVPLIVPNSNGHLGGTGYDQSNPLTMFTPTGGISPLFMIQSLDIESIEILKDADALAVYGAQAANGAILITTKKPKPGAISVKLTMDKGFTKAMTGTKFLNTTDYLKMRRAAFQNSGETPTIATAPDLLLWDSTRSTNWLEELYGNLGNIDNVSLSVSGGYNALTFNVGGSFSRIKEVTAVAGATKRNIINSTINYRGQDNRLQANLNMAISQADVDVRSESKDFTLPPNAPAIYDSLGNYNWDEWNRGQIGLVKKYAYPFGRREIAYPSSTTVLNLTAKLRYLVTKQLEFLVDVQRSSSSSKTNSFTPIKSINPTSSSFLLTGTSRFSSSGGGSLNVSPQLKYNRQESWGRVSLLMALAYNSSSGWNNSLYGTGYTNDNLLESITAAATITGDNTYTYQKSARVFSTFNYNYLNKYIVNLSASRDGSTKFGPGKKFGNFWSAGMAWIATEEPWVKKLLPATFSFVKFRGSYGTTGGDGVGDYKYLSRWGAGPIALKPYGGSPAIRNLEAVNPDFQWQVSKKRSFGVEMGLFKDKVNLSVNNYADRMSNQLVLFPIAITSGFSSVTANFPALSENKGWEISISADVIKRKSFSWFLGYNIGINKNKLLKYPGIENSSYRYIYMVGRSLNITPVLHYTGLDPLTGEARYMDRNKDGVITQNGNSIPGTLSDDRVWLDLTPKFFGGIQSRVNYNRWFLSFNLSYNKGKIKDPIYSAYSFTDRNIPQIIWDNTWKNPGDQVWFPKPVTVANAVNFANTDAAYTDAFYMTFTSLSLMHQIDPKILAKLKIKSASIGINSNDLFSVALSGYYRPDAVASGNPLVKTVSLKLDINF